MFTLTIAVYCALILLMIDDSKDGKRWNVFRVL